MLLIGLWFVLRTKKTAAYVVLVVIYSTIAGLVFGIISAL